MPKLPSRYQAALAAVCALGDEAHYEQTSRYAMLNPEAAKIIEQFDTRAERCELVMAYMDSYDLAAARQTIEFDLFGPREGWRLVA